MSLVLELSPQLESELAAQAARLQLPLAEYAMRVLAGAGVGEPKPHSGADLVAYWEQAGLIGTRPEITDPAEHARELRQRAEKRTR
jgi:hypothetical protein